MNPIVTTEPSWRIITGLFTGTRCRDNEHQRLLSISQVLRSISYNLQESMVLPSILSDHCASLYILYLYTDWTLNDNATGHDHVSADHHTKVKSNVLLFEQWSLTVSVLSHACPTTLLEFDLNPIYTLEFTLLLNHLTSYIPTSPFTMPTIRP